MKSIMEEASSIVKAIEKGWNSAGQPKEFSIKIFEEPQKNFIGMTTKPAKIGIFFTESAPQKKAEQARKPKQAEDRFKAEQAAKKARPAKQKEITRKERFKEPQGQESWVQEPRAQEPMVRETRMQEQRIQQAPRGERTHEDKGPIWTEEMIATAQEWLTQILSFADLSSIPLSVTAQHFHLKIQFQTGLFEDKNREKYFFASLSNLLLTMLKRHYKRPLKGYKIVLLGGG